MTERHVLDAVSEAFGRACAAAWDAGLAEEGRPRFPAAVVLPEGIVPGISAMQNPMTGDMVPVRRVPLLEFDPGRLPVAVTADDRMPPGVAALVSGGSVQVMRTGDADD